MTKARSRLSLLATFLVGSAVVFVALRSHKPTEPWEPAAIIGIVGGLICMGAAVVRGAGHVSDEIIALCSTDEYEDWLKTNPISGFHFLMLRNFGSEQGVEFFRIFTNHRRQGTLPIVPLDDETRRR